MLGTSRLKELRLHVILTSAAMMDDVFGMVVVQDISIVSPHSGTQLVLSKSSEQS